MAKINNSDSKKIKELIKKVKILSERGEKNERFVAKAILKDLMAKYQIKKFDEDKNKKRVFKLVDFGDCKTIMVHCILDTKPKASVDGSKQKKELYCSLTDEEYVSVCEKFNHYYPEFVKQREVFVKAFILANNLGIVDGESDVNDGDVNEIKKMLGNVKATNYKNVQLIAS